MAKHGKRYIDNLAKVDRERVYTPTEAIDLIKSFDTGKLDGTVEVHIRTGLNVRHAEEQLRGTISLPHGLGREMTVAVFAKGDKAREAEEAGADFVGAEDLAERVQNEARTYSNKVLPEAQGQAAQITAAAKAYADRIIAEAQGQADRFVKVYDSYKLSPDVSRKRMYLETMEQVLGDTDKVIIDEKGAGPGVIPYLPLQSLTPRPSTGASSNSGSGQ